jgi:hypothetical protein
MKKKCLTCYDEGLIAFIESRSHRLSPVTSATYISDGRRFSKFFIEGAMRVKGQWMSTSARGESGCVGADEVDEFLNALVMGGMAPSSVNPYRTPIEGALHFAPDCLHGC